LNLTPKNLNLFFGGNATAAASEAALTATGGYIGGYIGGAIGEVMFPAGGWLLGEGVGYLAGAAYGYGCYELGFS
jgi:hypothetical protein